MYIFDRETRKTAKCSIIFTNLNKHGEIVVNKDILRRPQKIEKSPNFLTLFTIVNVKKIRRFFFQILWSSQNICALTLALDRFTRFLKFEYKNESF